MRLILPVRTIRMLFTPAVGETVMGVSRWNQDGKRTVLVMSTDRLFHIVTEKGTPVVSLPRALDHGKYVPIFVGEFENPQRYFVWYQLITWLREPEECRTEPSQLLEYDAAGRELARRTVPPFPYPAASYTDALYGLVTPMTEAATLVEASRYVRSVDRFNGGTQKSSLLDCLENIQYYIPGTSTVATGISHAIQPPSGLIAGYIAMILLSGVGQCARLLPAGSPLCLFPRPPHRLVTYRLLIRLGRPGPDGRAAGMAGTCRLPEMPQAPRRSTRTRVNTAAPRISCLHPMGLRSLRRMCQSRNLPWLPTEAGLTKEASGSESERLAMQSLIWEEWRENFKWAVLPTFLIFDPMVLLGVPTLMDLN